MIMICPDDDDDDPVLVSTDTITTVFFGVDGTGCWYLIMRTSDDNEYVMYCKDYDEVREKYEELHKVAGRKL